MTPEHWQRIKQVATAARSQRGEARQEVLRRECGDDTALRSEIESLLRQDVETDAFLAPPVSASGRAIEEATESDGVCHRVGERLGDFQLLELLGEGGMSVVYRARQNQPAREVALKILHRRVLSGRSALRLFEREAMALARLQHPNIATIYASEQSPHGELFLVMELVRGEPLMQFVQKRCLPPRERLQLFLDICDGVAHAHERSVIHRDLKPANILVVGDTFSRVGAAFSTQPKILDFGLAKFSDSSPIHSTIRTEIGCIQGTLAYMSPEQAHGDGREIDARTDVYSLGVILCELVTSRTPFNLDNRALPEAVRIICEEPPRLIDDSMASLRGDLATIIRRCLEKDPNHRYATVAGLRADIESFLADRPIDACPPSVLHQFGSLVRRHRALSAAVAGTFAALCVGLVVSLVLLWRVEIARKAEWAARVSAERTAAFLRSTFASVDLAVSRDRRIGVFRDVLDAAAERVDRELSDQPDVAADVRQILGRTYLNLGLPAPAQRHSLAALELFQRIDQPPGRRTADAMHDVARTEHALARFGDAQEHLRVAISLYRSLGSEEAGRLGLAASLDTLGQVYFDTNAYSQAQMALREALSILEKQPGQRDLLVATTLIHLANAAACVAFTAQQKQDVENMLRRALELRRRNLPTNDLQVADGALYLAINLRETLGSDESAALFEETLAIVHARLESGHPSIPKAEYEYARLFKRCGELTAAETLYRRALGSLSLALGPDHLEVSHVQAHLAELLFERGEYVEAVALRRQTLATRIERLGIASLVTIVSLDDLAESMWAAGEVDEAVDLATTALDAREAIPNLISNHELLAARQRLADRIARARQPVATQQ